MTGQGQGFSRPVFRSWLLSTDRQNAYARTFQKYSSGADSNSPLNVPQQAHAIGDPVPIAFGRRRDNAGGILISPRVTECRFENDVNNAVTAYYHLVLSEGQIGSIQVRDVFQRQCRVGSFQQTYNRRAGSWVPENAIVQRVGYTKPEASNFCGSPGTYEGISTMSFEVTVPNGLDVWNRQVHAFIRNGIQVYRWADLQANVASDSFADLAYWLMQNSARIPLSLIDTESIRRASQFLDANNITTNCWLTKPINYDELISTWGRYHLLRPVNVRGKVGLKPLLQLNNDFTIKTSPITIDYTFNDDTIISESVSIDYLDWASRQPFVCQIIWRQQLDADTGVIRTAEVRYDGTAADGPYESHDLSEFCTREDHAVKVGAYILARRVRSNHLIRFRARPGLHSSTVSQGSIIRVRLQRTSDLVPSTVHDRVYEVERVQRSLTGEVAYEATHVPVDDQLRSLVALDVANAQVSGAVFSSISTGDGCDINSSSDTTVPTDDPADTILPGPEDPAIGGGTFPPLPQADFPVFAPEASGVVETAEFNRFVDEQTDARFIEIIDDLLDDTATALRSLSNAQVAGLLLDLTGPELQSLIGNLTAAQLRALTNATLEDLIAALTPAQIRALSDSQLEELFDGFSAAQIRAFSDEVLKALVDALVAQQIRSFSDGLLEAIGDALTAAQIRSFSDGLLEQSTDALAAAQVRSLSDGFLEAAADVLTAAQVRSLSDGFLEAAADALTAAQVRSLSDGLLEALFAGLTAAQVRALTDQEIEDNMAALTAAEVRALSDAQVEELTAELTASQVRSLSDSQVEELTAELTAAQVRSLSDSQVEEITSELTAAEIRSLDDANSVEFIQAATVEQIRALPDAQIEELVDELTDSQIRALSDDELNQLFNDLTPEQIRALPDADLAGLFDDLTADQIRALPDADLADVADNAADEALVTLLDEPVRDVVKEQLDLDFNPELVSDLQLKFKDAELLEDLTAQPDPLGDYETGLYFHSATWDANVLTVRMRLSPTGKAPRQDLGALQAAIASTSVVALLPDGTPASPQPESLPSLSFSGQIAAPWNAATEGLPVPPADRVFEGVFQIPFSESDFPPAAGNPAQQLTYRATVEFTAWNGGFTDVAFLNTLAVDFETTEAVDVTAFIVVANTNAQRDDNFAMRYAGQGIGTCDFSFDSEYTAYLFVWNGSPSINTQIQQAVNNVAGETLVYRNSYDITQPLPAAGANGTLSFQNIQQNNNGNYGKVFYGWLNGSIQSAEWDPDDGENASLILSWPLLPTP